MTIDTTAIAAFHPDHWPHCIPADMERMEKFVGNNHALGTIEGDAGSPSWLAIVYEHSITAEHLTEMRAYTISHNLPDPVVVSAESCGLPFYRGMVVVLIEASNEVTE